ERDIIIPLYMGTLNKKFNEDQISYILIQIKNHATNNKDYGYLKSATTCLSLAYIGIEDLLYMLFLLLYLQLGAKSELVDILSKFTETSNMTSCKCKIAEVLEDYKTDTKETGKEFVKKIRLKIRNIQVLQSTPVFTASSSVKVSDLTNSLKHLLSAWVDPLEVENEKVRQIIKEKSDLEAENFKHNIENAKLKAENASLIEDILQFLACLESLVILEIQ
ncbi:2346_t:CDS:2, partial [Cetraspora pellucida]